MTQRSVTSRNYSGKSYSANHSQGAKGKCPVCGFPYTVKTPTGNGAIYAHRNDWLHQVKNEK